MYVWCEILLACCRNKFKDNFCFDQHNKQAILSVPAATELLFLLLKLSSVTRMSSQSPFALPFQLLHVWHLFFFRRADILKNEMKVFFVKYNDPIYVKLEKLDIMIRLANQQNIAQVLAELKEWEVVICTTYK